MVDLPFGSILLLEDFDVERFSRNLGRTDSDDSSAFKGKATGQYGVTLSGLLNAIDGFLTPKGHILIITTNEPDKLDPAIRRRGRIDYEVEFANATREQIKGMFIRMFESERDSEHLAVMVDEFADIVPAHRYSVAELQEFFLTNGKTPEDAISKVSAFIG